MNKNVIGIFLFLGLVIAIVLVVVFSGSDTSNSEKSDSPAASAQTPVEGEDQIETSPDAEASQPDITSFSLAEVATHASGSDCWTIVNGSVYDITSYVPRHPGGEEILRACGADGTSLFTSRTTEDGEQVGSGTSHSSNAESILSGFFMGQLAN